MAQRTIVEISDDLGGAGEASTVLFALDGVSFEIDLNDDNAERLRTTLDDYIPHARRTGGRKMRGTARPVASTSSTGTKQKVNAPVFSSGTGDKQATATRSQAVREWAARNGKNLSPRGRIPIAIQAEYDEWLKAQDEQPNKREKVSPARKGRKRK